MNSMKLGQGRLDVRKRFFSKRVVRHWDRLSRTLRLLEFQKCLDNPLRHMV